MTYMYIHLLSVLPVKVYFVSVLEPSAASTESTVTPSKRIRLPILNTPSENVYKYNEGLIQPDVTWKLHSLNCSDSDVMDSDVTVDINDVHELPSITAEPHNFDDCTTGVETDDDSDAKGLCASTPSFAENIGENNAPLTFTSGEFRSLQATEHISHEGLNSQARVDCERTPAARTSTYQSQALKKRKDTYCPSTRRHRNLLGLDYDDSSSD